MVRIIIERHCHPGKEAELENLLVELRSQAIAQRGYVSGETLRSIDDPSSWLVLSTWLDVDLWRMWESSQQREDIDRRAQPLLTGPPKTSVYTFVWNACWYDDEGRRWDSTPATAGQRARDLLS